MGTQKVVLYDRLFLSDVHIPSLRALKDCTYTRKSDVLGGFSRLNGDSHKRTCKSTRTHSTPMIIPLKLIKYMHVHHLGREI